MSRKATVSKVEFLRPYTAATRDVVNADADKQTLDAMRVVIAKGYNASVLEIDINDDVANNRLVLHASGPRGALKEFAASIEQRRTWTYVRRVSSNTSKKVRINNTVRVRRIKRRGSAGYKTEAAGGPKYSPGSSSNSIRAHPDKKSD